MIRSLPLIAVFAAVLAMPAAAQLMGARELKVAVPAKGAPSSRPVADVFYLVGEAGAKEAYTFTGKGHASLTLFGPDGSEILTQTGKGTVKLEVVLPFTDVFTLAVARTERMQPYTLTRKATIPTFEEAASALEAGYATKDGSNVACWVVPGVKLRSISPNRTIEFTLAADRKTTTFFAKSATTGKTLTGEMTLSLDGNQVHEVKTPYGGKISENVYPLEVTYDAERVGRFSGYLCKN